jgi:hypothetical protein
MSYLRQIPLALLLLTPCYAAQETHNHPAPEKLGDVSFPISCNPLVQPQFNRAVALLHSFAYADAQAAFQDVAVRDPSCAMAHWGIAATYFHQLWEPAIPPAALATAQKEIQESQQHKPASVREQDFIAALSLVYQQAAQVPYPIRALNYQHAMRQVASSNRADVEAQVFYALSLLASASPRDKTHANQKEAAAVLEPLGRAYSHHPGIPHYLIHAYDNAELAPSGLQAAKAYAQIAPSAPHALHMPSHIFTRLGLWDDSITSNLASRQAAHQQGDLGEELHAMDYLVYAYLQTGRDSQAAEIIEQVKTLSSLNTADFKIGYASTVMPIRLIVERNRWSEAAAIVPPTSAPPHVVAMAVWARGLGLAHSGSPSQASGEILRLQELEQQLLTLGNDYWATQVSILRREVAAWSAEADNHPEAAIALMRSCADDEDAIEKLPVTPGPILPAREQLGSLLLEQNQPAMALKEFKTALANAPNRYGAVHGAERAAQLFSSK